MVSHPKKTRYIAEAKIKSDRVDSKAIAELVLSLEPIECYLRIIEVLNGEICCLSRQLRHLARDDEDVRLLTTILGVGYYLALLIKAEIGDVNRFKSGDHLCSYASIVPSTIVAEA